MLNLKELLLIVTESEKLAAHLWAMIAKPKTKVVKKILLIPKPVP